MPRRATNRAIAPGSISPPAANYAHACITNDATRWMHTSGVVPIAPDGSVPEALVAQARVIWSNIGAMLTEAEMTPADIVSVVTYVTPGHDLGPIIAVRDEALDSNVAASTLVIVAELARPEWLMEISVIAAN